MLLLSSACQPAETPWAPPESNRAMAQLLDSLASHAEARPASNLYLNRIRAQELSQMTPPDNPDRWLGYKLTLGREYLHAGRNRDAIATYEEVRARLDALDEPPENYRLVVLDMLGISYLRLAEEENCIDNPSVDRCLFPIQDGGIHQKTEGSTKALEAYLDVLAADPGDLNARWLANIAAMTLGQHPDALPEALQIAPEQMADDADFPRFQDIAPNLGVATIGLSGGAIMDDFDGDGFLDLMASAWGFREPLALHLSNGDGTFRDGTAAAGLDGLTGGLNLRHADYDNDGDLDVLVLRGAWMDRGYPNSLLQNDGTGRFTDVTMAVGLGAMHPTQTADWGDYDNDGDLDLFIGNETSEGGGRHACQLYRNDGGTFTNVAREAGVDALAFVKGVAWGDYDNDGRIDLYVSSWVEPNLLFRNEGPDAGGVWRFAEVGEAAGVREPIDSFPTWWWDYDNDGWLDLFVSGWRASAGDMAAEYLGEPIAAAMPRLYRNNRDGTFTDVAEDANLRKVLYTMGSNFGDLDGDGWLDLYAGTGDPDFRTIMPNRLFRYAPAEGRFQEITGASGMGHLQKGHAVAFGDLDQDGDQDVFTTMGGAFEGDVFANALFENPGFDAAHVTFELEGTVANRSAIGARVQVDLVTPGGERSIYRHVTPGSSFGANSLRLELGLGDATAISQVTVTWPGSNATQSFADVALGQAYRIREGDDALTAIPLETLVLARDRPAAHHHAGAAP
ncbi:MAG: CRTAC1 family protein [Bacteroidota bacterium]